MALNFVIEVKKSRAEVEVLTAEEQNIGNFTQQELEMLRRQKKQAELLDADNKAKNDVEQNENDDAKKEKKEAKNAKEVAKLMQMTERMSGDSYMNYQMLAHNAQEMRKAINRMTGLPDNANKFHDEMTSLQIVQLSMDTLSFLSSNGDDSAEIIALNEEFETLNRAILDWKDEPLASMSVKSDFSFRNGDVLADFIPYELGEKVKALLGKIENHLNKYIDDFEKSHPDVIKRDLMSEETLTRDYLKYIRLKECKKDFSVKKNNAVFFETFENNIYYRSAMTSTGSGLCMFTVDPDNPKRTNVIKGVRLEKTGEEVYNAYDLIPLTQYYTIMSEMGIIQTETENAHKAFTDKAKSEYEKAISEGKNSEEATNIAREQSKAEKEAYDAAKKKLLSYGAKLDKYYKKINENVDFVFDNELYNVAPLELSLSPKNSDQDIESPNSMGALLRKTYRQHSLLQKMLLNGWNIKQATAIVNAYYYLETQDRGLNKPDPDYLIVPPEVDFENYKRHLRIAYDTMHKLVNSSASSVESVKASAEDVLKELYRLSTTIGRESIKYEAGGADCREVNNKLLNQHMSELEKVLVNAEISPLEDDLFKDSKMFHDFFNEEVEKNKYTEEMKAQERAKALERKSQIDAKYAPLLVAEENAENNPEPKNEQPNPQPVPQVQPANQEQPPQNVININEIDLDNIEDNLNINAYAEHNKNEIIDEENNVEEKDDEKVEEVVKEPEIEPVKEEKKEEKLQLDDEEIALYYKEINDLTRQYLKDNPFDVSMMGFGAKSDVDKIETYHATKMIANYPVFLNDPKKKAVFDESLRIFENHLSNIKSSSGENILKKYNNGYLKMLSNPGYEELKATLMRYRGIVLEELKDIENNLPVVKDAVKDKIVNARAIELAFEEIKRSGNKANINECEKLYINTLRGMKGFNITPEMTIAKLFDEIHPYLEEVTENRITELTHHNERAELDRAREEAARRAEEAARKAEEARIAREAREKSFNDARNAIIDENIIDNAKRTTEARRKVLAKKENEEAFTSYLRNETVFKKVRGVLLDDDVNRIRNVNPLAEPPARMVRVNPRKSPMEQLNTLDLSKASTFLNDIMLRIDKYLTPEEKKQITDAVTNIHNAVYEKNSAINDNKGSMIAANFIGWAEVPAGMEQELEEFKKTFEPIVRGLDKYIQEQKVNGRDPLAYYYRDYYYGLLKTGESFISFNETDGVLEGVIQNLTGGITQTNSLGKLDFNKMRKDFYNFPILEAAANAMAIHRFVDTESLSIEEGEAMESNNVLKVLEYSKELKKNIEDMDSFPHEEYEKLAKAGLVQAGQEKQFKLGPGRGFQAAYDENNDRISALEHKWLVRDMPFISQAGRLARVFKNKIKNDTNLTNVQKIEMQNYIDYYNNEILKNSEPMTAGRRTSLMLGLSTRLYTISYPAVQIGIQTYNEGKYINSGDKRTYDRNIAASVVALLNQYNRTIKRELSNCEQQTMLCGNGNMTSLIKAMKDRWDDMPAEPTWHKSVFTKTPENDPFTNMKFKYELFVSRYQAKAAVNADLLGHPEKDPELVELAKQMGEAAENYIKAKDIQKKLNPKKKIHEKRKFNKENRSEYGQYRYELGEYLATAAGMVTGFSKNEELLKNAKPVVEEIKVNVNKPKPKAKTDDDLVKKSKIQKPAGMGRH